MNVIGIIAEYNPFHNGHVYHIEKIKERYPDSLIVLCLNGYFTERGTISVLSKEDKVKIALENKVDIVVELPFVYGTQASDIFAFNSVKLLNEFKIDHLVFGSESNNIELLKKVVDIQLNDPTYNDKVKTYLDMGDNYPTAMKKALDILEDISSPNDLLGISYIKAIRQINPHIIPETILRTSDYLDTVSTDEVISATNIREKMKIGEDVSKYMPSSVLGYLHNIDNDKLFNLLKFKILTDKDLSIYLDVDEGIEYRILKNINEANSFDELIALVKTKRYTYNKINRMLIHILAGLTNKDNERMELDYMKILGFSKEGQMYINSIKKDFSLPSTPLKDSLIYSYELKSAYLYEVALKDKLNGFDNKNIPIIRD